MLLDSTGLCVWLREKVKVAVTRRTAEKWLSTVWSGEGRLLVAADVEEEIGERLRLEEYKAYFESEGEAGKLAEMLAEEARPYVQKK